MNKEVVKVYWKFVIGLIVGIILYLYIQNHLHKVTKYKIHLPKLDSKMAGKKIVFLSDTHFKESTSLNFLDRILVNVEQISPDIILFGGDMIYQGDQETVLEQTKDFFYQLNKIAPTYVVYGDHDLASEQFTELRRVLRLSGAKVLTNETEWISFGDSTAGFWLMGLCERVAYLDQQGDPLSTLSMPADSKNQAKVLIAHHPEYFARYLANEESRPHLILSGHTLGGQVNLPRVGGVFALGQGKNPLYDFGIFASTQYPDSRMIVTSGIGNAEFPFRVNNRPEIVLIELE